MPCVTRSGLARKPGTPPARKGGGALAAMLGCELKLWAVPGGTGSGGSLGLREREEHDLSGTKPSEAALKKIPLVCL